MGEDQPKTSRQRVTVAQAAEILGVTVEAIRGRIKRKTLEHERHSGTVYVLLDADQSTNRPRPDTDQTDDRLQSDSAALISAKDETITTLRDQLEAERQAHAEARRIIAGLVERIPAIAAPAETPEASETSEEQQVRGQPHPDAADPQTLQDRSPGGRPAGDAATDGQDAFRGLSVWAYWLGVILTGMTGFLMQSGVGYRILQQFTSGLPESNALTIVSAWGLPLLLPIVFGYQVGRRPRGSNFWRHVGVTALL